MTVHWSWRRYATQISNRNSRRRDSICHRSLPCPCQIRLTEIRIHNRNPDSSALVSFTYGLLYICPASSTIGHSPGPPERRKYLTDNLGQFAGRFSIVFAPPMVHRTESHGCHGAKKRTIVRLVAARSPAAVFRRPPDH